MSNFIKLEIKDGTPLLGLEYEDTNSFRELMLTLFSPSSSTVFYEIIVDILEKNKASEDLLWFEGFYKVVNQIINDNLTNKRITESKVIMNPSSFR